MVGGNQQDLVSPATDNDVEVLQHISAENAQVDCLRVGERGKLTFDFGDPAVFTR